MLTSLHLHEKSREVCIKVRSPPASLVFIGQITEHTTVKWPIGNLAFASNILVGSGSIFACMTKFLFVLLLKLPPGGLTVM